MKYMYKKLHFLLFSVLLIVGVSAMGQTYNIATENGNTINTCSGTFVDAGGTGGNYSNNEDYTVTFCSSSGLPLKFDFSSAGSFDIDVPNDTLFFYDGVTATGTPIAILTWLDDNSQTTYSSQLAINTLSTCVTCRWKSNSTGTDNGWAAVISCGDPPTCANNPPAADIFGQATPICNTLNYCGTTSSYYREDTPFNLIGGGVCPTPDDGIFGATIENNSWLKFEALATSAVFDFTVSGGSCMSGIQVGVFSFDPVTSLFDLKSPCALTDAGQTGTFTLTASSLNIGEIYYLMIDGYAGDNCDYNIGVNTGVTIVYAGPDQAVCDTFATMAANSPMGVGAWSVVGGSGNFTSTTDPNSYVSGLSSGDNTFVWAGSSTFCGASTDTVVINVAASLPINLSCGNTGTDSIQFTWNSVTGATGYDITYSVNGGGNVNDNTTTTTYTVNGLVSGDSVTIFVTPTGGSCFSTESVTCYTNPSVCAANSGTVEVRINGANVTSPSNEYILCYNDVLELVSDSNYVLPPPSGVDPAGLGYAFYTAAPTGTDPALDPGFSGMLDYSAVTGDINTAGPSSPVFAALGTSNPYFWITAITLDDKLNIASGGANDSRGWDVNTDLCYTLGTPMKFTYVNEIVTDIQEDCSNGTAQVIVNGGSPELIPGAEYHITVSGNGTLSDTILSNSGDTVFVQGLSGGDMYDIVITDDNGCSITINGGPFVETPEISYTSTNLNCFGDASGTIDLNITGGNGSNTFTWSHDAGETNEDLSGLTAGTYSVTVTDSLGCTDLESIVITEPTLLTYSITSSDLNCYNDMSGSASLSPTGGTSPYSYLWSNSQTGASLSNIAAGIYTYTISDANGCDTTGTITITEPDSIAVNSTQENATCDASADGEIDLTVSGGNSPYSYLWNDGSSGQSINGLSPGTYNVQITDDNLCLKTLSFIISFDFEECLLIPTAFSPNSDGVNDTWEILHIEIFDNVKIQIFNRWGQIIFEFNGSGLEYSDQSAQWDGTFEGKELTANSFVYIVEVNGGTATYKGIVSIIKE